MTDLAVEMPMPYVDGDINQGKEGGVKVTYTNTLISDAQNGLCIRANDKIDVPPAGLFKEILFHCIIVGERQVQPLRAAEEVRIVCNRLCLEGKI